MSNVVDELITIFQANAQPFQKGASAVVSATHKVDEALTRSYEKAAEFGKSFGEKFKIGEVLAPLAALATAGGLIELGKDALSTAEKFDILERKIAGVTGSYERAKQIEAFAEKQSGLTGLFDPAELDQAAISLEKFGLSTEKYLPLVQALSAVSGNGMDEFADAFGMLAHGEGERALRVLERAGITIQQLRAHGLQISGQNKIMTPPGQAADIIGRTISDSPLGSVLGQMENSPEAKAKRASVAWEGAMRKIGEGIQGFLVPAETAIGDALTHVTESGQLDKIVNGFSKLFGMDGSGLKGAIEGIANALEKVPEKIKLFEDGLSHLWSEWAPKLLFLSKILASLWVADKILEFANMVVKGYQAITAAIEAAGVAQAIFDALSGVGWVAIVSAIAAGTGAFLLMDKAIKSVVADFGDLFSPAKKPNALIGTMADLVGQAIQGPGAGQDVMQTGYLYQIAQNTGLMAKGFSKFAFGGGDLARMGVTPTELASHHVGRGGSAMRKIMEGIGELVEIQGGMQLHSAISNGHIPSR